MPARSAASAWCRCGSCWRGMISISYGRAAPERADHGHPIVGEHQPVLGLLLGVEHGAEQAVALEAGEPGQLVGGLAGDERHRQQLAVGMLDRRARLPAAVDDRLAVAQARMAAWAVIRSRSASITRAEWLSLRSAQLELCSGARTRTSWTPLAGAWVYTGPEMGDDHGLVAAEGRVPVGHHPHLPGRRPARSSPAPARWRPRGPGRTGRGAPDRPRPAAGGAGSPRAAATALRRSPPSDPSAGRAEAGS